MDAFGLQHPFFQPVWRRVVTVAVCLGWAGFEFVTGEPFWGFVFAGAGIVAIRQFFLVSWPDFDSEDS